ncbi:MAG: SH3 domain-containing protein [Clostridia bacterium]|nr:SH3 domain-containing protein [Clostridia bacterium]
MIGVSGFVSKVRSIATRDLTYRTGGSGKDGTCDCIGLIIGAMTELGHKKYDMHSTNYFARYQVLELKDVTQKDLFVGQILFRTRESTEKLNARYQRGGRYYTGDLLDYYHVAVVTSLNPLEIIECTEYGGVSGIVVNTRFKNWQCGGRLRDVLYDGYEEERSTGMYNAKVTTKSGALNIREWPEEGPVIGKAPKGAAVEVLAEAGDGWPKVRYNGVTGYASEAYLARIAEGGAEEEETGNALAETVTIPREMAKEMYDALGRALS